MKNLNIKDFILIATLTGGIVASYFTGLAQSKDYVDQKIEQTAQKSEQKTEEIKEDVTDIKVDIAVVKQILLQQYGSPVDKKKIKEK